MPRRVQLPRPFSSRPFSIREARAAGLGEGRLRGHDLSSPFHGVRVPKNANPTFRDRCREYAPIFHIHQRFSHITAALIWGCPIDNRFENAPLHVSSRGRAPRSVGIVGHHSTLGRIVFRMGFPVSDAVTTWLQLASLLPLDELVIAADHLVLDPRVLDPHDIRPHTTIDALRSGLAAFHGRGATLAAEALELVRQGAESREETQLRLLILRSGFPEPEVNVEIIVDGKSLGWADLYFREWRTLAEYDGDHHRTNTAQYDKDILRVERLERAGEQVVRIRKTGLHHRPAASMARLAEALRLRGWTG